ncbi:alpha-1,3-mannosyl-glycoprotein 2-beta-N-acetylglucosaminyltransferase-like [Littorina saxatilis]|uniref:Alpha-1,3-mannosyl-glycoprotein 2-beta-N-acetylglucosaminyltransferase n=1 Tax=Littorina saxatilis TaxID=31220 RepID=A0AAN9AYU5_9CAEN
MPRLRRTHLVLVGVCVFLSWNILTYYSLVNRNADKELEEERGMEDRINGLQSQIAVQMKDNQLLLDKLRQLQPLADDIGRKEAEKGAAARAAAAGKVPALPPLEDIVLPILMIACDRTTVSRSLDILLKYRPSAKQFPIIVSQDCGHEATSTVIQSYITAKKTSHFKHIKHPDLSDIKLPWPQKKFMGYYKIARHYKWALNQVFHVLNHSAVIIVEDDLDIAPDFFEYFLATYPLLHKDPLLWCVSAWNDNGKGTLVSNEAEKLYRTDFFPGLGWMIERSMWTELGPKWPDTCVY